MHRVLLVSVAAFFALAWPAGGFPIGVEARWCAVHNPGLGNIQWDCRFPTLALCAAAVGPSRNFCLENPNWHLLRYRRH